MAGYQASVLVDHPRGYFRMDTSSGNLAYDMSGNNQTAQLSGNFTLSQPGALLGDSNTAIYFPDTTGTISLPYTLNYTTFTAFTLEFWIQLQGGSWHYIVVTCDGTNTTTYLNTAVTTPGIGGPIEISSIFDWAGSSQPASLDELAIYDYVLPLSRIQAHYQAATTPDSNPLFPTEQHTILPLTNKGNFGIGIYQPISGGTTVGQGFLPLSQSQPYLVPYSGIFGGTYGYFIENAIRAPQSVAYQPAQSIGLDAEGVSIVRGYPQITWTYGDVRPDVWYEFYNLYRRASYQPYGFQYLVLLQYPDPLNNGALTRVIASWDPLQHGGRDVGSFKQIVLHFSYVGKATLTPSIPIQTRI